MGKVFKSLFFLIITVLFISGVFLSYINKKINEKVYINEPVEVEIKKGSSLKKISELLKEKGIITDEKVFYLYSRIKGKPLKAGFYLFSGHLSIHDIWEILYKGKEHLKSFTVYPGDSLFEIGERLEKSFNIKKSDFFAFVFNPYNVKKYGLEGLSFEGYFPPDTYYFRENENLKTVVKTFVNLFKKRYFPFKRKLKDFSFYETMIIASLVEKESSLPDEKPVIAGVIINRLKKGMLLQVDPTTIYALKLAGRWKGKLTKENIHFNSLFNTYVVKGLPPTPICSFSVETFESVINYKKTDYLYYLTKDGKKHIFSKTYREHINVLKGYER